MVDMMHSSAVFKPNLYFYSEYNQVNILLDGKRPVSLSGHVWAGDIGCLTVSSPRTHHAVPPDSAMKKMNERSGKLEKIRSLIINGKYRIDAEKLAEKLLSNIGGLLTAN